MANKDREAISKIISRMLDNPDANGVYHTSAAFTELEHLLERVRAEAVGWGHADACITLDRGDDPRLSEVPDVYARALVDLTK